jgi:phosphodiesterase/alkaline phosphatase D-like protein
MGAGSFAPNLPWCAQNVPVMTINQQLMSRLKIPMRKEMSYVALIAASLCGPCLSVRADVDFLGVAAGDATDAEAVLWTRALDTNAPSATTLAIQLAANDPTLASGAVVGIVSTQPARDYTAKLVVTNLLAGTRYYYRFLNAANPGNASIIGTFKTAPGPDSNAPVRLAFSGDCDGLIRPYSLANIFPSQNLDFFVFDGDTIYETASAGSPSVTLSGTIPAPSTNGATQVQLFSDYSKKYREQFIAVNPGGQNCLQPMFASQGNYTLLDNHELGNRQYINGGAAPGGPVGDMPTGAGVDARVAANDVNPGPAFMNKSAGFQTLQQVYINYQPLKERGLIAAPADPRTDGTPLLFFGQRWGRNAMFINADDRTYRDIRMKTAANADDTGPRAGNTNRTMLGATQFAWLKQTLLAAEQAGIAWKIVTVSDPIDQLGPIGGALNGVTNGGNVGYSPVASDGGKSWIAGYRAERNALLKFITDNHIYNVVFLATDDHQNRVNELAYSPTGGTEDQSSYIGVPHCFTIVDGPLGATGPDLVTNHTFANNKLIVDSIANAQIAAGIDPVGLAGNYPGLHNVARENDPQADTLRQPVDFYSPDTFNFNTLDISADGSTLTVTAIGINSYAQNSRPEYDPANNPARQIFSFQVDAFADPQFTSCPGDIIVSNDVGQCSAVVDFSVAASGRPEPAIVCTWNGQTITSPFTFPGGTNAVTCIASNAAGTATCSFNVIVKDVEAPVASVTQSGVNGEIVTTLFAIDNCDGSNVLIYVKDSAQGACGGTFSAGPYSPGSKVVLSRNKIRAGVKKGSDGIAARITTVGNPVLVVTDSSGNTSCTTLVAQ